MARQFRIGFDARLAGHQHAGIGRYSEELLRAFLQESGTKAKWVVFTFDEKQLLWLESFPQVERRITPIRHYTFQEQLFLWRYWQQEKLDLLYVPHFNVPFFYTRPFVVTIHDLLWHRQRDARATTLSPWMYRLKYWGYRFVSEQAILRAKKIFVPTSTVESEVREFVPQAPTVVTSEGLSEVYRTLPLIRKARKTVSKSKPYVVYTGSLYPHKNLDTVFQALVSFPQLTVKLVSVRTVFTEQTLQRARELGVGEQVQWLGSLSDQALIDLYCDAVALVQPSLSEGFGLTGVEAMAAGCPVVASDIPVFREVYKKHASFFPSQDAQQLTQLLRNLQKTPPSVAQLQAAQKYAQSFSWNEVAKMIWEACQEVLSQKK